ncbi:HD domain-containing protein [Infirmifilum lucidum]|uniref:5'-deoxynucleotidase n=1 Tax=Infirmifilum lucidum TaxID=2776706 RepID=A0A7L9FI66_9CREN|nr:HD domain-containing protein [Infirmifilum lucidum]QOJ78445.1 HD domain-containing protein [Infirmifilum lucidum]
MKPWSLLESAKWLARTGWMMRGVPASIAETVSQHSWEAGIIAFVIASRAKAACSDVDPHKAAALGLVHDLLEGFLGDIPRYTSLSMGDLKNSIERKALKELGLEASIERLLEEWMEGVSVESRIARVADSIATYLQALRYMGTGYRRTAEIAETSRRKAVELSSGTCFETVVLEIVNEVDKAFRTEV